LPVRMHKQTYVLLSIACNTDTSCNLRRKTLFPCSALVPVSRNSSAVLGEDIGDGFLEQFRERCVFVDGQMAQTVDHDWLETNRIGISPGCSLLCHV
jgi:hypothetical protein